MVQDLPRHLRPPEVEAGEHGEHHGAEQHVVEVGHDEVGVADMEVQRRRGQDDPGEPAEQERGQEPQGEQHGRLEGELPAPDRAGPVEELDPGRHRDEERQRAEEREQHHAGGEHVVGPHAGGQAADRQRREDQTLVTEHRAA